MNKRTLAILMIAPIWAHASFAQPTESPDTSEDIAPELQPLLDAFYAASEGDLESAEYLYQALAAGSFKEEQWQDVFGRLLADVPFSPVHTNFWEQAIGVSEGRLQIEIATYAGLFAVEAIVLPTIDPGRKPQIYDQIRSPAAFLLYLADGFSVAEKGEVFDALWRRLGQPGAQAMSQALRQAVSPANYPEYIQFALTLAEYMPPGPAGAKRVGDLLGQPELLKQFWIGNSIFLFDEGGLTPAHVQSLESLVRSVPRDLHSIGAFIFPDSTNINPTAQGFTTSVQLVYLSITSMGDLTDPGEFLKHVGQPSAPAFTIAAAEQVMYAVQELQFSVNPSLRVRRDSILGHAKWNYEAYMRRDYIVPIETYADNPDSLLPSVSVLWFIDSNRTFAIAKDLFQLSMNPAMDSVLLVADMLSGGSGTAPTFRTDLTGRVDRGSCQIVRTHLTRVRVPRADRFNAGGPWQSVDLYVPSGIKISRYTYDFELNDYGGTHRLKPLHDPIP